MSKGSAQPLLVNVPAGSGLPQYYHQPAYQTVVIPVRIQVQPYGYRRSPCRRFICSLLVAAGLWAVIHTVVAHYRHHGYRMPWGHHWDTPYDLALTECGAWEMSPAEGLPQASFEIPLNRDTVLLLSRYRSSSFFSVGPSLSGNLEITTSTRLNNTAKIVVQSLNFADTRACLMTGSDGEIGVGIFRKGWWFGYGLDAAFVKIDVVLPQSTKPLQLKGIVADLPNFSFNVGNLKNAVEFKSASLKTSNAAVKVKSLVAEHANLRTSNAVITADFLDSSDITLKTSNAGISGTFNTSGSLQMTTSNAPIDVTVGLESNAKTRPTTLTMRTSNHRLNADVSLSTAARRGGNFSVTGTTSNGPLGITFPSSPVGSALRLAARTSNTRAEVALHGAYEGSFSVATSNNSPLVKRRDETDDGRRVEYDSVGSHGRRLHGHIYSKEGNKEHGEVRVTTSNAPVVLLV